MNAIVQYKHRSPNVLELQELEKWSIKDDHVLGGVHAASVTPLGMRLALVDTAAMSEPREHDLGTLDCVDPAVSLPPGGAKHSQFLTATERRTWTVDAWDLSSGARTLPRIVVGRRVAVFETPVPR